MRDIAEGARTALGLTTTKPHYFFFRHKWPVRVCHWINAICLAVLLMSGLNIFNAHPALYLGSGSNFEHPVLALNAMTDDSGNVVKGTTWIAGKPVNTTGVLGASRVDGELAARGFPSWATLPGAQWLAMARQWHFAFAWLLVINGFFFFAYGFLSRHFARDLAPTKADIQHLPREIVDHARLKFPHGEEARHYNGLQKLAYCFVLFLLAPLIVATGLTMSPTMDAAFPILLWIFGGRQTARTIHFICAFSFLGFFIVHIAMVVLSGTWNNLRSMITGWYVIRKGGDHG
ncbi:MAG: cytochrome b/b6 domain-containing protein [Alphaproteobacteria bacterium]|nr:cytochrome b/b6 domain-containing protein [Alphaproteobacteria bacterium]